LKERLSNQKLQIKDIYLATYVDQQLNIFSYADVEH
jgi:hypothetical protein